MQSKSGPTIVDHHKKAASTTSQMPTPKKQIFSSKSPEKAMSQPLASTSKSNNKFKVALFILVPNLVGIVQNLVIRIIKSSRSKTKRVLTPSTLRMIMTMGIREVPKVLQQLLRKRLQRRRVAVERRTGKRRTLSLLPRQLQVSYSRY